MLPSFFSYRRQIAAESSEVGDDQTGDGLDHWDGSWTEYWIMPAGYFE